MLAKAIATLGATAVAAANGHMETVLFALPAPAAIGLYLYTNGRYSSLIRALTAEMMRFAPDYVTEPEKAIYRIYRDTRFSEDKTPYKTHVAAVFPR